ncbi:hypothetical protein NBRC116592_34570 [Colwellia sp. KU-HH00111]|uniref:DUF5610 domain-containing protein n=1 Tax=Colwellia sp. KU-HH00111 TaxID=3127652 RepID=UPI0031051BE5
MNHINKPFGFNPMANSQQQYFNKQDKIGKSEELSDIKPLDNISINEQSVVALKIVHQSISAKFSLVEEFKGDIRDPQPDKPNIFDFEAVASNVMSFVNSSLVAAETRGASSNELQEMLGQARQGANNGIDEAIEELSELNAIDAEINEGIEKSRDLINTGLDETEQKLTDGTLASQMSSPVLTSRAVEVSRNNYESQSNSSDLSITTADGDIVSISFSALEENKSSDNLSYYAGQDAEGISYQSSSSSYSQMNFSYSVQGDLDEDELYAIQSLIADISKIENDFFSGNIDEAFDKAVELGYDEEQLSSFSLELKQTQTNYISQAYTEVANYDADANEQLNSIVQPVLDFIGEFKELRDNANELLDQDEDQFSKLLESVFNSEFDQNQQLLSQFTRFIDKLS